VLYYIFEGREACLRTPGNHLLGKIDRLKNRDKAY